MQLSTFLAISIVWLSAPKAAQQSRSDPGYRELDAKLAHLLSEAKQNQPVYQERQAKVARIVSSAGRGGNEATGVPYFVGYDQPSRQTSQPFNGMSLAQFTNCSASNPSGTGINWLTVEWECPVEAKLPWAYAATSFKFDGIKIIEIRTHPGAVRASLSQR